MAQGKSKVALAYEFIKGLWNENAVFRQLLGMCPTLAVTNSAMNGLAMGLATTFVLVSSTLLVSFIRKQVPHQVRIASYVLIIATFVTIADLYLAGNFPAISKALGPYVPLIVVNCIILGRAEGFASKHGPVRSFLDAAGMGGGFVFALVLLGSIREILGSRSLFGFVILGKWFEPWVIMILPAGAFITLGLLVGFMNMLKQKSNVKNKKYILKNE